MSNNEFILKEEHFKLLKAACVSENNCEFGSPSIDCKRPFGNSDVIGDMIEILGIDIGDDAGNEYDELREELEPELLDLYQDLYIAVPLVFSQLPNVRLGRYVNKNTQGWGDPIWKYVDER